VNSAGLSLQGVRVAYGRRNVLHDVSLEIAPGEFCVLLGPSGSGKSTLLAAISGLVPLAGGRVLLGGRDITRLEPAERNIALVFQSYALYPSMSVRRNLTFGMRMRGVPRAERQRRLAAIAAQLQLSPVLDRRPAQLSGGQRQRVAIGRALLRDPLLFLFDEPLSNLDAQLRAETRAEIRRLHERLGTTTVYVTHDQVEAMTMASRIAVMRDGRLLQTGTPRVIYDAPANVFVARFVGAPGMNLVDATLRRNGAEAAVALAGMVLPLGEYRWSAPAEDGRPVVLGLRPEDIRIAAADEAGAVTLVPALIEPTGPDLLVRLALAGTEITARLDRAAAIRVGEPARFALDLRRASLFCNASGERL
jgi:multiple sugar transport system ATP-binding protein